MTDRELMQQSLDALEGNDLGLHYRTIEALRAARAQPAPAVQVVLRQPNLFAADPAAPAVNCEWTNCPRRVGDVCCNDRPAAPAVPASIVPKWTDEELAQGRVGIRWVRDDGVYGRPSKDDALAYIESRWPTPAAPAVPAVREPLTDAQIEQLREKTFSVNNPYCPVDSKSMRKAVRAAERAHGITGDSK